MRAKEIQKQGMYVAKVDRVTTVVQVQEAAWVYHTAPDGKQTHRTRYDVLDLRTDSGATFWRADRFLRVATTEEVERASGGNPLVDAIEVPAILSHGSQPKDLQDALFEASNAVMAAYEMVRKTRPNERDYIDAEGFARAKEQHEARLDSLDTIANQLIAVSNGIHDQTK